MNIFHRFERVFARFAIPGLIRYVVGLNALVFILLQINPGYSQVLDLDRAAIMHGEIWRLASWIFIPDTESLIWIIFYLMFTWWIGDLLEQSWGTFRLNAYYFLGMILCIASAMIFGASAGNLFLNLSLFLAVATLAPNLEILLFLLIPVKIKWLALFSLLFPVFVLIFGSIGAKMIVVMCLGNYLLFFGPSFVREMLDKKKTQERRARFEGAKISNDESLHCCEVCGITEKTHPEAEFRVSADGREYCAAHLLQQPR